MNEEFKKNPLQKVRGRGAESNSTSRFDRYRQKVDLENYGWLDEEEVSSIKTQFFKDTSRTILTENDSPDVPFRYSVNAYRGCEHGCIYCYARPTHEYLGLSSGLDFESKIFVKEEAPELLRERLMSPRWKPETVVMSGVTDCYQPAERRYEITRRCLQVFAEFKNPTGIITKNQLVLRDLDVLQELAKNQLVSVYISMTTLDTDLARLMEPRTSSPKGRLNAITQLAKAGVNVGVNVAPVIPGLTDHELPEILKAAADAGATSSGYTVVRLPHAVKDLFTQWLETHRPLAKEKVLGFQRDVRGGQLYRADFGSRMKGEGPKAENIRQMYELFSQRYGFNQKRYRTRKDLFCRPGDQLNLF